MRLDNTGDKCEGHLSSSRRLLCDIIVDVRYYMSQKKGGEEKRKGEDGGRERQRITLCIYSIYQNIIAVSYQ